MKLKRKTKRMNKYNIVFAGTPDFGLPALDFIRKNHNLLATISQPDRVNTRGKKIKPSPVKKYSLDNNIEIFQPEDINSKVMEEILASMDIDFIVVVAYGQYIGKNIRAIPKEKIVNIHASLLPKYRGAAPIHRAIMDREKITGVSIMEVGPGMDKGDLYYKKTLDLGQKNLEEAYRELANLGGKAIIQYLQAYKNGEIETEVQEESKATYAKKVSKEDGYLDFESVDESLGKILGLYPRPGASFSYKDNLVKALGARVYSREERNEDPGSILGLDDRGLQVACKDGIILIDRIQFPASRPMDLRDYIRGNSIDLKENLRVTD